MISGIEIFCFGASYTVALALEITRLFFRSSMRSAVMLFFGAAGLLAQSIFLIERTVTAGSVPLSSSFDWYLVASWVLVAFYLYMAWQHPRAAAGIFILPLVLVMVFVATFWADRNPFPAEQASLWWGIIHGTFMLLGTVAVLVGFVSALMYLVHAWRLKHKLLPRPGFQLPSLEWLQRVNARAMILSTLLLGIGLLSGTVLNLVNHQLQITRLPWSDPVVWSTMVTIVWLFTALAFFVVYKPARQGRKVAYLTLTSFAFLVFSLSMGLFFTDHRGMVNAVVPVHTGGELEGAGPQMRELP